MRDLIYLLQCSMGGIFAGARDYYIVKKCGCYHTSLIEICQKKGLGEGQFRSFNRARAQPGQFTRVIS